MYDDSLKHSGVMGMHWGQRRYQNEDGSYKPGAEGRYYTPKQQWGVRIYQNPEGTLTSLGRRRLQKGTRSSKYQDEATAKYKKEFNQAVRKANGGKEFTGDGDEAQNLIGEEKAAKMYNKYLDNLASAKIKDLGIKETKQAKDYVNSLFEDDRLKEYSVKSLGDGKTSSWWLSNRTKNDADFKERYRGFEFKEVQNVKDKLKNAKTNDKWDTKFLEMVQNKKIYNDQPKLLKEYEKYLNDPSNYRKHANKLEDK